MESLLILTHNGFGNMAYMLSCGLPCVRRKGAQEKEGFHNIFEEKREGQIETGRKLH